jgi:hypothetical protein
MDATEDYLPLWLELHLHEEAWLFELRSGEERAVVVGSHSTSDVRVARPGVASTHFHFERARAGVVIVPGYRAALLVDRAPAQEPTLLSKSARVEFCGALLEATVHDVPPLHMLLQARHGTDRMMHRSDYIERLPEDTDPTVVAIEAVGAPQVSATEAPPNDSDDAFDMMTTTAWRAAPPAAPLGPQGTIIIPRPTGSGGAPTASHPLKPPSLPPIAPPERIRLDPWNAMPSASPESSPTRVEVPRPHGSGAPPRPLSSLHVVQSPAQAAGATAPSLAPIERAEPPPRSASVFAQLGLAASRHPLRVAGAALPLCVVLALALVGASRLAGRWPVAPPTSARAAAGAVAAERVAQSQQPVAQATSSAPAPSSSTSPAPSQASGLEKTATTPSSATAVSARPKAQRAPRAPKHVFLGK